MLVKYMINLVIIAFVLVNVSCGSNQVRVESSYSKKLGDNLGASIIEDEVKYETIVIEPTSGDKVFERDYLYRAGEDDSKNSSRDKAIFQIKKILGEEIGVYVESYLEINETVDKNIPYSLLKREISNLSVAITKIKILSEKWDGHTYYVKANVRVNEEKTMKLLLLAIKSKSDEKDMARLDSILKEQDRLILEKDNELKKIGKQLVIQEILTESKKNELLKMKSEFTSFQKDEIEYKRQLSQYGEKLKEKMLIISKLNKQANSSTEIKRRNWVEKRSLVCEFSIGANYKDISRIARVFIEDHKSSYSFSKINEAYDLGRRYSHRVCPSNFLQKIFGYNCIYLNIDNRLLSEKHGC